MSWIAAYWAVAAAATPAPSPWYATPWRVWNEPGLHVGVRGHFDWDGRSIAAAVTVQVTGNVL